jgi:colicin import membrane protein
MALAHDALLPRGRDGMAPGAALALLVHLGLVAALTVSVDWRTPPPETVSAELWSAVPQSAAPPPAPPPAAITPPPAPVMRPAPPPPAPVAAPAPPAPDPEIALEKRKAELAQKKKQAQEQEQAEREAAAKLQRAQDRKIAKAEAEKAEKAAAEKDARTAKAEADRLAQQREENLKRMMGQAANSASASGRAGNAARDAAPSASYAGAVAARIRRELVFAGDVPEAAVAEVLLSAGPSGTIIARSIAKSSGYRDWDDAVLRAIDKTGTLPRDTDGRVPSSMTLVFRRRD